MLARVSPVDRIKYAFKRLSGLPIETDLSPYAAMARRSQGFDLSGEDEASLRRLAVALRSRMPTEELPLCLALAAEACRRRLGLEPYGLQLVAAAAICSGRVAQMQTGEGKTLAAALAACYCAMRDGCLHVVTANDYLARRDAQWMAPIYEALGLAVASVVASDGPSERRAAYGADVVYLTARELGFDYLRDGLAYSPADLVQRGFSSAIVDEADFVLVDEARVPLVIAGAVAEGGDAGAEVLAADRLARSLAANRDFLVDPEGRKVSLSLEGQARTEAFFGAGGMHTREGAPLFARVHAALHAHRLLARDVDYLVKDGRVVLVDAFTGWVAEKRRWPWGIQAALEAKEGLGIGPEGRTYGSIAVQHLMGLYPRIAAMTATAAAAAGELAAAYGMATVIIPPEKPSRRRDEPDAVFADRESRNRAVVAELARENRRGRPVLVGTSSVLESEELAAALAAEGIGCVVLNARNDEEEARLIAVAGLRGAVTVSTNMAGRGVDIRLGEDYELLALGGLYVIGVGRGESRRMDDQLRGRAGRQGDPGLSRFFLSLEDPFFERYGVRAFLPRAYRSAAGAGHPADGGAVGDPMVAREIARAQAILEGRNSAIRRSLRKYSLLVEYDRLYARELRDRALSSGGLPAAVEEALAAEGLPGLALASRAALARAFDARLDEAWARHLSLVEDVKEGLGLLRYGGGNPGAEYVRIVGDAFEAAMRDLEAAAIADGRALLGGEAAPVAEAVPALPSSTWTYVATEDPLPGSALGEMFRAT